MKEVKAYVHHDRIADVISALKNSPTWGGVAGDWSHNLAVVPVKSLLPHDKDGRHYSIEVGDEVVNEFKVELICEDSEAPALIDAITAAARTGQPIAGWISVSDLGRATPIR